MTAAPAADLSDIRLYLATPVLTDAAKVSELASELGDLLPRTDIAAVLVRLAPAPERTLINHLKALAPIIQNAGVAMLVDGHADLVARAGADGAHVGSLDALNDVLQQLKPDRIVGVGGLNSRHDAMVAGEAGADYVLFGEADANGALPSQEAVIERVSWWAEVFVTPCVGYAPTLSAIDGLAEASADFILLGDAIWNDPRGARAALAQAAATIDAHNERAAIAHKATRR